MSCHLWTPSSAPPPGAWFSVCNGRVNCKVIPESPIAMLSHAKTDVLIFPLCFTTGCEHTIHTIPRPHQLLVFFYLFILFSFSSCPEPPSIIKQFVLQLFWVLNPNAAAETLPTKDWFWEYSTVQSVKFQTYLDCKFSQQREKCRYTYRKR